MSTSLHLSHVLTVGPQDLYALLDTTSPDPRPSQTFTRSLKYCNKAIYRLRQEERSKQQLKTKLKKKDTANKTNMIATKTKTDAVFALSLTLPLVLMLHSLYEYEEMCRVHWMSRRHSICGLTVLLVLVTENFR